jgi:hypothetical protein
MVNMLTDGVYVSRLVSTGTKVKFWTCICMNFEIHAAGGWRLFDSCCILPINSCGNPVQSSCCVGSEIIVT